MVYFGGTINFGVKHFGGNDKREHFVEKGMVLNIIFTSINETIIWLHDYTMHIQTTNHASTWFQTTHQQNKHDNQQYYDNVNFEFLQNIVTTFLKNFIWNIISNYVGSVFFCYGVVLLPGSTKNFKILFLKIYSNFILKIVSSNVKYNCNYVIFKTINY